jgi:hypothetical protein
VEGSAVPRPHTCESCTTGTTAGSRHISGDDRGHRRFEQISFARRFAAKPTCQPIKLRVAINPDAPALQFLPNALATATPIVITHRQFVARVT